MSENGEAFNRKDAIRAIMPNLNNRELLMAYGGCLKFLGDLPNVTSNPVVRNRAELRLEVYREEIARRGLTNFITPPMVD